jgi:hypothetical protein
LKEAKRERRVVWGAAMRSRPSRTLLAMLFGVSLFTPKVQSHPEATSATALTSKRIRITVTTASDAANGDTSTVKNLISNSGSDGISLREAILATNNDPGRYTIRFARAVKGADIRVGSATGIDLPTLTGGGVWIDGDIDGDSHPDVTLRGFRPSSYCVQAEFLCAGFRISSSGNELRNLSLRRFATGVLFTPASASDPFPQAPPFATHRTYANNVMSGMVMRDITRDGIALNWGSPRCDVQTGGRACATHNRWTDTTIVRNSIETDAYGLKWTLANSIGDRVERWMITDNTIRITDSGAQERIGIRFEAGLGVGSVQNRISDVMIARNEIGGHLHRGVRVASGVGAGDRNTIERVRIIDNLVALDPRVRGRDRDPAGPWCGHCFGVDLFLGESSEAIGFDVRPIDYADRNLIRDIEIRGNEFRGPLLRGVAVSTGCCGSARNRARHIHIGDNTIQIAGLGAGVFIDAGSCCSSGNERATRGTRVSDVTIDDNSITIRSEGRFQGRRPAEPVSGGIVLVGGIGRTRGGMMGDVSVTNNVIDTTLIGISLVGGVGAEDSSVSDVRIQANQVLREPSYQSVERVFPGLKGISLIGAWNGARRNRVACVVLSGNVVAGIKDDASIIANGFNLLEQDLDDALEDLGPSPQNTASKACPGDPERVNEDREDTENPAPEESPGSSGGLPWPLILLGSAAMLGAAFLVIRLRTRGTPS